jgi:hypothetical protein
MADKSKSTNMGTGKFPRPYINNVARERNTGVILYQATVAPDRQLEIGGIGYASSGLPEQACTWPDQIVHVQNRTTEGSPGTQMPILKGK